jgi:hypothetical protein
MRTVVPLQIDTFRFARCLARSIAICGDSHRAWPTKGGSWPQRARSRTVRPDALGVASSPRIRTPGPSLIAHCDSADSASLTAARALRCGALPRSCPEHAQNGSTIVGQQVWGEIAELRDTAKRERLEQFPSQDIEDARNTRGAAGG